MEKTKSFEEMSRNFQHAFGIANSGNYKAAIPLYEKAIKEDPKSFAAINNLGLSKIHVAIEEKDVELIKSAIADFKEAIRITKEVYHFEDGYPIAEGNLEWAENELSKFNQ
jgi:tetratricopeptide (TPR) repeat protein